MADSENYYLSTNFIQNSNKYVVSIFTFVELYYCFICCMC